MAASAPTTPRLHNLRAGSAQAHGLSGLATSSTIPTSSSSTSTSSFSPMATASTPAAASVLAPEASTVRIARGRSHQPESTNTSTRPTAIITNPNFTNTTSASNGNSPNLDHHRHPPSNHHQLQHAHHHHHHYLHSNGTSSGTGTSFHNSAGAWNGAQFPQPSLQAIVDSNPQAEQHIIQLYYLPTPLTNGFTTTHTLIGPSSRPSSTSASSSNHPSRGGGGGSTPTSKSSFPSEKKQNSSTIAPTMTTNFTRLSESTRGIVHLSHLGITELIITSPTLSHFSKLKSLRLRDNRLTEFPTQIFRLENLQELDLSKNFITHVPGLIGCLGHSLRQLYLQSNQLQVLPQQMGQLKKLTLLDITDNQLRTIPVEFYRLMALADKRNERRERRRLWQQHVQELHLQHHESTDHLAIIELHHHHRNGGIGRGLPGGNNSFEEGSSSTQQQQQQQQQAASSSSSATATATATSIAVMMMTEEDDEDQEQEGLRFWAAGNLFEDNQTLYEDEADQGLQSEIVQHQQQHRDQEADTITISNDIAVIGSGASSGDPLLGQQPQQHLYRPLSHTLDVGYQRDHHLSLTPSSLSVSSASSSASSSPVTGSSLPSPLSSTSSSSLFMPSVNVSKKAGTALSSTASLTPRTSNSDARSIVGTTAASTLNYSTATNPSHSNLSLVPSKLLAPESNNVNAHDNDAMADDAPAVTAEEEGEDHEQEGLGEQGTGTGRARTEQEKKAAQDNALDNASQSSNSTLQQAQAQAQAHALQQVHSGSTSSPPSSLPGSNPTSLNNNSNPPMLFTDRLQEFTNQALHWDALGNSRATGSSLHHQNSQNDSLDQSRYHHSNQKRGSSWTLSLFNICAQVVGQKLEKPEDRHFYCSPNSPCRQSLRKTAWAETEKENSSKERVDQDDGEEEEDDEEEECVTQIIPEWILEQIGLPTLLAQRRKEVAAANAVQQRQQQQQNQESIIAAASSPSASTTPGFAVRARSQEQTEAEMEMELDHCSVCGQTVHHSAPGGLRWQTVGVFQKENRIPVEWVACSVQCRSRHVHEVAQPFTYHTRRR